VADIVARVGAEIWIVEVKTSLSIALIVQAHGRRRLAHRTWIAAPYTRGCAEAARVVGELGIGVMLVRTREWSDGASARVTIEHDARRLTSNRRIPLAGKLRPEHKTHAKAGAIGGGGRWTPFRDTCEQLRAVVASAPGITLKEGIAAIRHHYTSMASARGALAARIESGLVPGVRLERDGKAVRLYPVVR
jgi:hypothetical protein